MNNPGVNPTERIFSPQTVCVPASGVYIARALNPAVPGTKAEVLALAVDMGAPNGAGANFTKLAVGMKKRYGLSGTVTEGAAGAQAAVKAAFAAGPCVIGLAGDQLNLAPHYQANHIGHAIAVLYPIGDVGLQLDPLAPAAYRGDAFDLVQLAQFATAAIVFRAPVDCAAAVKAATDPLNAKIAQLTAAATAAAAKVANARAKGDAAIVAAQAARAALP